MARHMKQSANDHLQKMNSKVMAMQKVIDDLQSENKELKENFQTMHKKVTVIEEREEKRQAQMEAEMEMKRKEEERLKKEAMALNVDSPSPPKVTNAKFTFDKFHASKFTVT